jgi:pimeloyl-ACP methyl ester carboxylesterase
MPRSNPSVSPSSLVTGRIRLLSVLAAMVALASILTFGAGRSRAAPLGPTQAKPTIVLVHGAWASSASWNGVIGRLEAQGYTVDAPPNPLHSLMGDAETIADYLKTIQGPIVLVGHSYGGMVVTNAAYGNPNVKALVYVDAFAPANGESTLQLDTSRPGSALAAPPATIFNFVPFPGAAKGDAELYVKTAAFVKYFANDLSPKQAALAAATQSPAVFSALNQKSGPPAWKSIPSWYVLGTIDRIIPPAEQLFMAQRMHAHITRIHAGHISMVSHPGAVSRVILSAAHSVG